MRGVVLGVARNDVSPVKINGRLIQSYSNWTNILNRCYSKDVQIKQPSYVGCSVSDEWLLFSNFKTWFDKNHVDGWAIDKDLLIQGNKVYSEESCIFIPASLNSFTVDRRSDRGSNPIGVCWHSRDLYFMSTISINGKLTRIGCFDNALDAHKAWYKKKLELAYEYKEICDSIHPMLFDGLIRKIELLKEF